MAQGVLRRLRCRGARRVQAFVGQPKITLRARRARRKTPADCTPCAKIRHRYFLLVPSRGLDRGDVQIGCVTPRIDGVRRPSMRAQHRPQVGLRGDLNSPPTAPAEMPSNTATNRSRTAAARRACSSSPCRCCRGQARYARAARAFRTRRLCRGSPLPAGSRAPDRTARFHTRVASCRGGCPSGQRGVGPT